MNTAAVIALIAQYGPAVIPLIQQCVQWIESGKTTVTAADLQILANFASKTSNDYLKAAGIQITADGKVAPITPPAPAA